MKLQIGDYEIRTRDSRNLEVVKRVKKTIKSQMIADRMNEAKIDSLAYAGHDASLYDFNVVHIGDTYESEDFIGYYGNLEDACIRIINNTIITNGNAFEDADDIIAVLIGIKEQIVAEVNKQK